MGLFLSLLGITSILLTTSVLAEGKVIQERPKDIISAIELEPSLRLDARYFGSHNFVGTKIDGYNAPKCLLTRAAADALRQAQMEFKAFGLTIKIYDCYRPQKAVDHFVRWAKDLKNTKMKAEFYPQIKKENLFADGYIAEQSGHSRASTVDLTIIPIDAKPTRSYKDGEKLSDCRSPVKTRFPDNGLDMGTGFDCFDPQSHTANMNLTADQRRHRLLLKAVMEKNGFENYEKEWWHFTLKNEPYPESFFDFPVE